MDLIILILNILGTFLLSIEAIKIENLKKIITFFRKTNSKLNPKIKWVDKKTEFKHLENYGCYIFLIIIILAFSPLSFILIDTFFPNLKIYLKLILTVLGALIIWTILIYLIELIIKVLTSIERYTSKGMIGIIGFIILTTSFILQYKYN